MFDVSVVPSFLRVMLVFFFHFLCLCLLCSLHTLSRESCLCSLVALSLMCLHHSESSGLCASVAALIVSRSVSKFFFFFERDDDEVC